MEVFIIYLWLKLDTFIHAVIVISFITILIGLFYWGLLSEGKDCPLKTLVVSGLILFCSILVPSSKDMAILVGSSYAIDFAKSPEGLKIQTLIRKKANIFLDEQLKEVVK